MDIKRLVFSLAIVLVLVVTACSHGSQETVHPLSTPPPGGWPISWTGLDTDANESGCNTHRNLADVNGDGYALYYATDSDYLYLRMETATAPGWPSTAPQGKARYKWWFDTAGMDIRIGGGGTTVYDGEFLLILEDRTDTSNVDGSRDQLGELTLMDDLANIGFSTRWNSGDAGWYISNTPGGSGNSSLWKRVLGSGTAGVGGPQGVMAADIGYRIDNGTTGGNFTDMYVSWAALGNPSSLCLMVATDNHNPNLDQAPNCDRPATTSCLAICVPPVAAFNATPISGCAALTVDFTDQSTGNITSWNWTFGDGGTSTLQNPSHQYTSAGSYNVTLNVTTACASNATTKINYLTVYPNPTVNITPNGGELTCATTFIILTADTTGSACTVTSYQWYKDDVGLGGETGTTLNVTSPGDYKVEVACANGCTDEDEVTVTQSADYPTVNITPDGGELNCVTTFIILTADTTGSACTVTSYQWYKDDVGLGGQTGTTLNVTSPGDYKVEVTCANGCTDEDEVTVTQDISIPSVNAGPDQEVCEDGGPITLSGATPSGGAWSGTGVSGDTFDPSGLTPGDYTVTYSYTDTGTGCSNSDTKTVTVNAKPTADAGPDAVITVGGFAVIGGTPTASGGTPLYTYSWTPTTDLNNASFANPEASPTANTTYTVTVTDSKGCTDSDDMTVTVIQDCCICGFVYRAGTTEPLVGWVVVLEKQTNPWVQNATAITDANGKYCFCGLAAGEYRVFEVVQPGWSQVSPLPNEFLVTLPGGCCDPQAGPFLNFQNQQGGPFTVGWEVSPVDRLTVVAPWIALFAAIVAGTSLLALKRRRV